MKLFLTLFWVNTATRYSSIFLLVSIFWGAYNPFNLLYDKEIVESVLNYTGFRPIDFLAYVVLASLIILMFCKFGFYAVGTYFSIIDNPVELKVMSRSHWACDKAAVKVARKHLKLK